MVMGGHKSFPCKRAAQAVPLEEGPMSYQLVGEVKAHQGNDGYGV